MASPHPPTFVHRTNSDGTTDSVCMECLMTVCSSLSGFDLIRAEKYHVCNPELLEYWKALARGERRS
ncbi:MAG TPA: hypothetical protein VME18_13310 [Acidobacteriaceae bacterium]|nr:hypothetical protein [Acidobacteriaceae bacterium]